MSLVSRWKGVFPAMTTQFFEDRSLDLESTKKHIEVLIDSGVDGLVMLGSLGENNTLTRTEKLQVIECARDASNGRIPVVSGVSEMSTEFALSYMNDAIESGADGFMVLPCMSYHSDERETLTHYSTIARSVDKPMIIYNNPIAYAVDITPPMLQELSQFENYVAIKESCGDVRRITDVINELGDRYTIFCGVDDLAFEATALGAEGWISGINLAFPEENNRLWELMMAGHWDEARELYRWYTPLLHLDVGRKFVQNIKLAIQEVGLGKEYVRAPRLDLAGEERESVLGVIRKGIETRPLSSV